MQVAKQNKFDCTDLLDDIELAYQDLNDALGVPFTSINKRLMRSVLASLFEEVLHQRTDERFRTSAGLTKDIIRIYFEEELNLDELDLEDIDQLFVQPLLDDTKNKLSGLLNDYDRFYSKWEVSETENFPIMSVVYKGDYRIDDWHRITDVRRSSVVVVKKHQLRRRPIEDAIRYNLRHVDDLVVNDVPILIDKILAYYTGKEVEELYSDFVGQLKVINNFDKNGDNRKALKQAKSIIKSIEEIPAFARFREDLSIAERIYSSVTKSSIIFDVILPNMTEGNEELRSEILKSIDDHGFVEKDVAGRVESIRV